MLAEAEQYDMGTDAHHTEDAALGTPADHLHCVRIFLHQLGTAAPLAALHLLKHLRRLQLVKHLQRD